MICLGKSYRNHPLNHHNLQQNKQNIDQNVSLPINSKIPKVCDKINGLDNKDRYSKQNIQIQVQVPLQNQQYFNPSHKQPQLLKKPSQATTVCSQNHAQQPDILQKNLKQLYSSQIAEHYSQQIFSHITSIQSPYTCSTPSNPNSSSNSSCPILSSHSIPPTLRSKMLDWMIEVLSSYKMSQESFFKSVNIMDSYLALENKVQSSQDIHIIGIVSMFMAMKYQEIYPVRLAVVVEKIGRKKFSNRDVLDREARLLQVIGFQLGGVHVYDVVKHIEFELRLGLKPSLTTYFSKILLYLSKMSLFCSNLACTAPSILAPAIFFIALKTLEQVHRTLAPQQYLPKLSQLCGISQEDILNTGREVLQLAKSFSRIYGGLGNLKKFNRFQYQNNKDQ